MRGRKKRISGGTAGKKRKLSVFGALLTLLVLAALFAEQICPFDPYLQNYDMILQPPGPAHLFGTDRFGRDLLSRVIIGGRTSIFSTFALVGIISAAGTFLGILCGCFRKKFDSAVMRISDVCLAFPGLVFALAAAAVLGEGIPGAVLALAAVSWPKYARIARSRTFDIMNSDYIAAARLAGDTGGQLIVRHILPGIAGQILVTAALDMGTMMMELSAFSFLGLGAQPPSAEWGSMISGGRSLLQTCPWVVMAPGAAIFISVSVFNLFGDALRDYLEP